MAKTRVVVGPVVVLPDATTGKTAYYYQGSVLPDGLDEERVKSCIADGLVREDVKVKELTVDDLSAAAAGDRLRAAGSNAGSGDASDGGSAGPDDGRPPKTATKEAWIDFRVTESDGRLTKEQLSADGVATKAQLQDDAFVAALPAAEPAAQS